MQLLNRKDNILKKWNNNKRILILRKQLNEENKNKYLQDFINKIKLEN